MQRILRMTDQEADEWLTSLKAHIRRQHAHLFDPDAIGLAERGTLKTMPAYLTQQLKQEG